jgi:hypothetical protein
VGNWKPVQGPQSMLGACFVRSGKSKHRDEDRDGDDDCYAYDDDGEEKLAHRDRTR